MSGGLTDSQARLARYALFTVTKGRLFPNIVETVLFAIFTVLICVSTSVLVSKGLRSWPNRVMLTFTLFMYTDSALEWAADIKVLWNELNVFLPELLSPTIQAGEDINSIDLILNGGWLFTSGLFAQVNIVLSDAVVLWRACVVWNWHKVVVGATLLLLKCLVGVNIVFILSIAAADLPSQPKPLLHLLNDYNRISAAVYSLSAFVNLLATGMVACKAWIHRRDLRRYLENRTAKSAVGNILTLLVESGLIYSIFLIVLMLTAFPSLTPLYSGPFFYYWGVIMGQISGMYPTLVIVLVALQKTHCEHQFSFVDKRPDATVTLPFSVRVPQSRTSGRISAPGTYRSLQLGISQDVPDVDGSNTSPDVFTPQEKEHMGP